MRATKTTVVFSTPSYALHLAEIAQAQKQKVSDLGVRAVVLAGEPGGSVPSTHARLAEAWQADIVDHAGASEVGPWGLADERRTGLHINEAEFIAEFLSLTTGGPASEGELSELVLTGLGRKGYPVVRYRTGDLVRPTWNHDRQRRFVFLEGGVLGRNDDMLTIRAVNVFPSAIEQILRSFPEVHEFRLIATRKAEMDELTVEIEDQLNEPQRVGIELQMRLGLRVEVRCVPLGSLPRFEGKGKRFVDQR
jgi:phenylacetate-CoA ligase